jgi:2-polyprenyl-3-methyl-5-hydroxy-6-metoxy-1,4-benzoquinol methylase
MMFNRNTQTYGIDEEVVDRVLDDPANPLCQIAEIIASFDGVPTVLDIGAGNGLLSMLIAKGSPKANIDGIEASTFAADIASHHYRNFYTGNAHDFMEVIAENSYDFIVLADVIEHMPDPLSFLKDLIHYVGPSTKIILSTPNVAFGAVRVGLMNGDFHYVDSGLLERTHLRFFTYETLLELIRNSGFNTLKTCFLFRHILKMEIKVPVSIRNFCYLFSIRNDKLAHVYQFLVVLGKDPDAARLEGPIQIGKPPNVISDFFSEAWNDLKGRVRRD